MNIIWLLNLISMLWRSKAEEFARSGATENAVPISCQDRLAFSTALDERSTLGLQTLPRQAVSQNF